MISGSRLPLSLAVGIFPRIGRKRSGIDRISADHMGMLATVINALALQDALEKIDVYTRTVRYRNARGGRDVYPAPKVRHLERPGGHTVAGTGNPYFSTDTTAALRAMEVKADVILKATKVDGIYDADPVKVATAKMYSEISYIDVLTQGLGVMDSTAISLCKDNRVPIIVFNIRTRGNIRRVIEGEKIGSLVY
jgi:uridylate kinase